MASTFTTNANLEKVADGEQNNTWGQTLRANWDKMDDLFLGYLSKAVGGASDVTLTEAEYDHRTLVFTGTLTGNINVIFPAIQGHWWVFNNTSGSFTLTCKTSGGTGVAITQGDWDKIYGDATNIGRVIVSVQGGGTGAITASAARTNLGLAIGTNVQAFDAGLTDIAGLAVTDGNVIVGNGSNWVAESGATARTSLGAAATGAANTFTANQTIRSADAGADAAPGLTLDRNSDSAAVNDVLGQIPFQGRDSGGNTTVYGNIQAQIIDPTDGSEDGRLRFRTIVGGVDATRLLLDAGLWTLNATGGDQGADTINASAFFDDGDRVGKWKGIAVLDTSSGTEQETTAIPAGTTLIKLAFENVSLDATAVLSLELGSTTYSTTGTGSIFERRVGAIDAVTAWTGGVMRLLNSPLAAQSFSGVVDMVKMDDNEWIITSNLNTSAGGGSAQFSASSGVINLSGAIDRLKISGTNLDGGKVEVRAYF